MQLGPARFFRGGWWSALYAHARAPGSDALLSRMKRSRGCVLLPTHSAHYGEAREPAFPAALRDGRDAAACLCRGRS